MVFFRSRIFLVSQRQILLRSYAPEREYTEILGADMTKARGGFQLKLGIWELEVERWLSALVELWRLSRLKWYTRMSSYRVSDEKIL